MNREEIRKKALTVHRTLGGKLSVNSKGKVKNLEDLSLYYSPGVGDVAAEIAENPDEQTRLYTGTNNSVAIISDGSAVLGLGNIGPEGALPVMEGKAMLFNQFAGIDGYPIVLDVHSVDELVSAVKAIAPSFGAINLEDIAAPQCFEIENRLKAELDMPIMHDDQHGTAIVVLAGLLNALKLVDKKPDDLKIVIVGSGAAGIAITKLLSLWASEAEIIVVDSKGIVSTKRKDLNQQKEALLEITNPNGLSGDLTAAIKDADVFIGVSRAGLLTEDMVKTMAKSPIIFALANPDPEILPEAALSAGAITVATGRSDYPNQINNALAFPGIFRGALDNRVNKITDEHKLAAAKVIASLVDKPTSDKIVPDVFDERLVGAVSDVIN